MLGIDTLKARTLSCQYLSQIGENGACFYTRLSFFETIVRDILSSLFSFVDSSKDCCLRKSLKIIQLHDKGATCLQGELIDSLGAISLNRLAENFFQREPQKEARGKYIGAVNRYWDCSYISKAIITAYGGAAEEELNKFLAKEIEEPEDLERLRNDLTELQNKRESRALELQQLESNGFTPSPTLTTAKKFLELTQAEIGRDPLNADGSILQREQRQKKRYEELEASEQEAYRESLASAEASLNKIILEISRVQESIQRIEQEFAKQKEELGLAKRGLRSLLSPDRGSISAEEAIAIANAEIPLLQSRDLYTTVQQGKDDKENNYQRFWALLNSDWRVIRVGGGYHWYTFVRDPITDEIRTINDDRVSSKIYSREEIFNQWKNPETVRNSQMTFHGPGVAAAVPFLAV